MRKRPGLGDLEGAPYKVGDEIAGRYRVKDTAGMGPLGYVFRAQDKELDVEVAVKLISPRFVQSDDERKALTRTLKVARKFTQPNLARVYDEGQDSAGWPFYTLPFLDGLTVRKIIDQRLAKGQFFTLREVEPILSQLVSALEAVHTQGPHGNVKPSNIIIQPDLLKLTDYGLPLAIPRQPFTAAQKSVGNERYLPPEYLRGEGLDVRSDQYSLGVLVGEMLAGITPEEGEPQGLGLKNPLLDGRVESFYGRAVNDNPSARFRSLRELLGEFIALLREPGAPSRTTMTEELPAAATQPPSVRVSVPPPVPDEDDEKTPSMKGKSLLKSSADRVQAAVEATPEDESEPPSPDATIPISAEELAARLGELLPKSAVSTSVPTSGRTSPSPPAPTSAPVAARKPAITRPEGRIERMGTPPAKPISRPPITRPPPSPVDANNDVGNDASKDASKDADNEVNTANLSPPAPSTRPIAPPLPASSVTVAPSKASSVASGPRVEVGARNPSTVVPPEQLRAVTQDQSPTMAFETILGDPPAANSPALFSASRQPPIMSRSALLLGILSISGIVIGALVGTWWLDHVRHGDESSHAADAATLPAESSPQPKAPQPAPVTPSPSTKPTLDAVPKPPAKAPAAAPSKSSPPPTKASSLPPPPPPTKVISLPSPPAPTAPRKEAMLAVARSLGGAGDATTCPDDMRFIPTGAFRMGSAKDDPMRGLDDRILGDMQVAGFCVDQFEFPNQRGTLPLVGVTFDGAKKKCEALGKRLCSEPEWERACKGPTSTRFPYGSEFDPSACNTDDGSGQEHALKESGRYAKCRSGFGVADLSGNAAEWVAPTGSTAERTQKGGSFSRPDYSDRCAARKTSVATSQSDEVGFRCCVSPSR